MIELVLPQSLGEWLAWCGALYLIIGGVWLLFVPDGKSAELTTAIGGVDCGVECNPARGPNGAPVAAGNIGLAITVMLLHPQPLLYLALGGFLSFRIIGRLVFAFFGNGNSGYNWMFIIMEGLLTYFCAGHALGLIA